MSSNTELSIHHVVAYTTQNRDYDDFNVIYLKIETSDGEEIEIKLFNSDNSGITVTKDKDVSHRSKGNE